MVADLVDQNMADDRVERFFVLDPVFKDGAAVEPDVIGHLSGADFSRALRHADPLEQAQKFVGALQVERLQHILVGIFGNGDLDVVAKTAERFGQSVKGFLSETFKILQ